jgi:thiol:disulfide interchange protein DsbC
MFRKPLISAFAALAILLAGAAAAAEPPEVAKLRQTLQERLPGVQPESIAPSPVPGLFEVVIGARLFYMTGDARYLLQGSVIDLVAERDISEARRSEVRLAAVERVGEDTMIVFAPQEVKHTVTVFTDPDCPYCRKLHDEMDELNALGIKIRYLLYPRAGAGSRTYVKTVSAWCAEDRNQALTDIKAGAEIPVSSCDNPVETHRALGETMGITGTPTLVLEDGRVLPGYVPAQQLLQMIEAGS